MARRGLTEINAGSMADIAFLLLIFFLVTTTMDRDSGLMRLLPPPLEDDITPPIIKERNVFEVLANANDQLLVEKNLMAIEDLKEAAKIFLTNPTGDENLPQRVPVVKADVIKNLNIAKANFQADSTKDNKKQVAKWERKLSTIELIGSYEELPPTAVISLQNDRGTSYDLYVVVQNELSAAISELRNDMCMERWNIRYDDLDDKIDLQKRYKVACRAVYPQRISEAEPRKTGTGN